MDKKIINIGFVGHSFCGGNLGLGALAFGELYALQEACKRLGYDYRITSFETGINHPYSDDSKVSLKTYNLRNIVKTSRLFSSQDILFDIGGGDSFADIYGAKLYVVQMFIKLAVLFSRKPYVLPPQTYGPYSRWWTRCFANYYIKHAKAVFARDMISAACLSDINKKRVEVITDLGFLMSWQLSEKFDRFTVGFFRHHVAFRASCYRCKFTNTHREADMTIGDYWKNLDSISVKANKGASVVILNSKKGDYILAKLSEVMNVTSVSPEDIVAQQPALRHPVHPTL